MIRNLFRIDHRLLCMASSRVTHRLMTEAQYLAGRLLLAMPGIAQTPAARDRRVVTVDDGVLYSFGSRTPEALAELIPRIHATGQGHS